MRIEKVAETIVAIFAKSEEANKHIFLGTGGFFQPNNLLVTADHVLGNLNGSFAICTARYPNTWLPAELVRRNQAVDLALLDVPGYSPISSLEIAEEGEIRSNENVICFDYSTAEKRDDTIFLNPATRLGNVTRLVNLTEQYGKAGEEALELSFPALRGASGAPVMSNQTLKVWGIVIANLSYHLLPSQIERIFEPQGQISEETRFLLPQAIAVNAKQLRPLLQE